MFDPYHKWLGIPEGERPPTHYQLLGVARDERDHDVINAASVRQSAYVRSFQLGAHADDATRVLNELAAATVCLLDPKKRAAYDATLRPRSDSRSRPPQDAVPLPRPTAVPAVGQTAPPLEPHAAAGPAPITLNPLHVPAGNSPLFPSPWPAPWGPSAARRRAAPWWAWGMAAGGGLALLIALVLVLRPIPATQPDRSNPEATSQQQATVVSSAPERRPTPEEPASPPSKATSGAQPTSPGESRLFDVTKGPRTAADAWTAQESWAKRMQQTVSVTNSIGMELLLIPPGKFLMGIPDAEKMRVGNENQVEVSLNTGYRLGKYEVTQEEWKQVMGSESRLGRGATQQAADFPETYVSWDDAVAFCRKLTNVERATGRLSKDQEYRLPTEAEWEYACRAGTTTRFYFGDDRTQLAEYAWWGGLVQDDGTAEQEKYAHRVGQKLPNAWGLYDMCGNASEWCVDWYADALAGGLNPHGPEGGQQHVLRGGGWDGQAFFCMSGIRNQASSEGRHYAIGFRVALVSRTSMDEQEFDVSAVEVDREDKVDLLALINLQRDVIHGTWRRDGAAIVSPPVLKFARLQVPYKPPPAYAVTANVERIEGTGSLALGLVVGKSQPAATLDGWDNRTSGLALVDGHWGDMNETTVKTDHLLSGGPHTIVCRVHPGRVEVFCDDRKLIDWQGDSQRLAIDPRSPVPRIDQLYLVTYQASYRITKLEVVPLGDEAGAIDR